MCFGNKPAWSYKSCFSVWFVLQEHSHEIVCRDEGGGPLPFLLESSINDWQILTFCCVSLDCHAVQSPQLHPANITNSLRCTSSASFLCLPKRKRKVGFLAWQLTPCDVRAAVTVCLGLAVNPHLKDSPVFSHVHRVVFLGGFTEVLEVFNVVRNFFFVWLVVSLGRCPWPL